MISFLFYIITFYDTEILNMGQSMYTNLQIYSFTIPDKSLWKMAEVTHEFT
jgi:hypothetical protein